MFAELADRVRDAVIVQRDGIVFANRQFAALLGVERAQLIDRKIEDLVAPEFADFLRDNSRRCLAGESAADRFEVEIVGFQAQFSRLELVCRRIDWERAPALLITGVEIVPTTLQPSLDLLSRLVSMTRNCCGNTKKTCWRIGSPRNSRQTAHSSKSLQSTICWMPNSSSWSSKRPQARAKLRCRTLSVPPRRWKHCRRRRHHESSAQRMALESIGEAIVTTDTDGRIVYVNPAGEMLLGATASAAAGNTLEQLLGLVDDREGRKLSDPVMRAISSGQPVSFSRRAVIVARKDGSERAVEISAAPMRDAERNIVGAVLLLHDVTEMRGMARQMSYQATHDGLTGLVNRGEFERRVDEAITTARRGESTHVLCYMDLDRFKAVNDTSGHLAGDALLREVARLLREAVRDSDTVARLGGDEFGLLLVGCPLDKARQISDDLCRAIGEYRFIWKDRIFTVGASIGLVELARESGTVEEVLAAADSACYVAKGQGSGNVAIYSAQEEAAARHSGDIQWLQKLQAAIRNESFELYQQPIVPAVAASANGPAMEVLVRLRDEDGKLWGPADFLLAAERYRLMPQIDRWVVRTAIHLLASGGLAVPSMRCITVNVSGQTLGDIGFLEFVVDCLDRSGVAPSQLCFEMSESAAIANIEHARRFASVLHGMGCRFALDDFGSGVGSFSNLKNLPLDYLKIDGSFTRNIARDTVNQAMVAAMIKLARTLNFEVIAEAVEDNASLDYLRRMGVDFVQGHVIARAEPLSAAA